MDRYAVLGHPITHSLSPQIHALFARQTKQTLDYSGIELPVSSFETRVWQLLQKTLKVASFRNQKRCLKTELKPWEKHKK